MFTATVKIPSGVKSVTINLVTDKQTTPVIQPTSASVAGYYCLWYGDSTPELASLSWDSLTHVILGKAKPSAEINKIKQWFDLDDERGKSRAKKSIEYIKSKGKKCLLMFGGSDDGDGVVIKDLFAAHSKQPEIFAKTIVEYCKNMGFDGVDIDWEPVAKESYEDIVNLCAEIKNQWSECILYFPCQWPNSNYQKAPEFESFLSKLHIYCEKINVMSYAMFSIGGGWNIHHSSATRKSNSAQPTSVEYCIETLVALGIPQTKIGIGIGAFGHAVKGASSPSQSWDGCTFVAGDPSMSYDLIKTKYLNKMSLKTDPVCYSDYLTSENLVGDTWPCNYISYETPRSVAAKSNFCRSKGVNSFIVWTLNQDVNSDLIKAIHI